MTANLTIIGLGEIGTSLAMAFKEQGGAFFVTGSDYLKSAERRAEENQWTDKIEHNLFDAIENADTVILAVPADQTRKILELIGQDLGENTIVLDCCPNKTAAAGWARQYLKAPENYVGVWFGVNPELLGIKSDGGKTASPELFKGSSLFIAADPKTSENTIKLASGLADMLGMECSFVEPLELDAMIAASYHLPVLASHAMLSCLTKRSGWLDGKKAAGKVFYEVASLVDENLDQEEKGTSLLDTREHTVRMLNEYIIELKTLRDVLQNKDENGLRVLIEDNEKALNQWLADYKKANVSANSTAPAINMSASEVMAQTFFGGLLRRKPKN